MAGPARRERPTTRRMAPRACSAAPARSPAGPPAVSSPWAGWPPRRRLLTLPPAPGPHKSRECLPLALILRNRLKYALTYKEVTSVVKSRAIKIDAKVRTEKCYPVGFMGAAVLRATRDAHAPSGAGAERPRFLGRHPFPFPPQQT